jgi:hypothetical protein
MVLKSAPYPKTMLGLDTLLEEIYVLRSHLNELSRNVDDLSNPQLVEVSQILDQKLNNYNQMALEQR